MNTEDSEFERIERKIKTRALPDAIHHTDPGETLEYITGWNDCRQVMLAEQPAQQEPTAKRLDPDDAWNFAKNVWNEMDRKAMPGIYMQLVTEAIVKHYTSPPAQRKPLTDEQIFNACAPLGFAQLSVIEVARAIEAAHNIRENT